MTHWTNIIKTGVLVSLIGFTIGNGLPTVNAQQENQTKPVEKRRVREAGRDPFRKYEPPRVMVKKSNQVLPPSIQERIAQYKAQKAAAMSARLAAPKPTTALLLNELQVVGISRTPRGYAAIVEATPIKLSYVIYPGERFYDGQLVAIEDNQLVFRKENVYTDGRRERVVEMKPLRQPSVVTTMSAVKTEAAAAPAAPETKAETTASPNSKP